MRHEPKCDFWQRRFALFCKSTKILSAEIFRREVLLVYTFDLGNFGGAGAKFFFRKFGSNVALRCFIRKRKYLVRRYFADRFVISRPLTSVILGGLVRNFFLQIRGQNCFTLFYKKTKILSAEIFRRELLHTETFDLGHFWVCNANRFLTTSC